MFLAKVYRPLKNRNTHVMNAISEHHTDTGNWSVYLILCANGALYCGISNDVAKRWAKHCAGKGAKYTRMHKPVALRVLYSDLSESAARQQEYQTKHLTRADKHTLWQGLSEFLSTAHAACKPT